MLEFGKSYVVSLGESMVMQDGTVRWAIFGDYKCVGQIGDELFLQFGDVFVKVSNIRALQQADSANTATINDYVLHDCEKHDFKRPSHIGCAHAN